MTPNGLAGSKGDIFWNLPSTITYLAGQELGCTIYVANPTDEPREYCLMAELLSEEQVVSEESIIVHGYSWFEVDANDFVKLLGALSFNFTNVLLVIQLIEKESNEVTDSVTTYLVAPTAAQWPPGWPGAPGVIGGVDWLQFIMMLLFMVMVVIMVKSIAPKEEKKLGEEKELELERMF